MSTGTRHFTGLLRLTRRVASCQTWIPATIQRQTQLQTRLFGKKAAKMGQHLQNLDEFAHKKAREITAETKQATKSKSKNINHVDANINDHEPFDDDLVFDDDDDTDIVSDIPQLPNPNDVKRTMQNVVTRVKDSFQAIRGGEPTPAIFDAILVDAYGERTPLAGVAQVVVVSPTLANVTCFDPALSQTVCNAIRDALELNPILEEDGNVKVPLPRVSLEIRQQTVKKIGKQAESARIRLRNIRHKAMETIKQAKDGKMEGISKDAAFRVGKDIDAVSEAVTKELNAIVEEKQARVMAV